MNNNPSIGRLLRSAMLAGAISALCVPALAQNDSGDEAVLEEIITTGTRIRNENINSASPITSIGVQEIEQKQTPNIERIFRDLPMTIPGDGENVNNGTAGQASLDLRGLGPGRSLILIDGHRLAPYDINGVVTTDVIPINMIQRVDVVTGGASAVYGSDAMSGAVNFILKEGFEGVELDFGYSDTNSGQAVDGGGGHTEYIGALFGVNSDDDRSNITLGVTKTSRGSILLAEREFGIYGVSSATGSGLGSAPAEPDAACSGGEGSFTTAFTTGVGSTTSIPGTLDLRSGNSYQFRDDMSLATPRCARFNFNPFNYYQTPQERFQATATAHVEVSDNAEIYGRVTWSSNESNFRIAPSGTFGSAFTIPVMNPFFSAAARTTITDDLNAGAQAFLTDNNASLATLLALPSPTQDDLDAIAAIQSALAADPLGFNAVGIQDFNNDGVFDTNDAFTSTARRRTIELGARSGQFKTDYAQYVIGARGELPGAMEGWNYDVSYSYAKSDFTETRDGFTNLTNLALGINTVSATECRTLAGVVTDAPCTPINVFGPVGSITEQQRADGFFIAIASDLRRATQTIWDASIDGTFDQVSLPWADDGLSVAFGMQFGDVTASSSPDECLKLAPASCQGGAGGNRLPVNGQFESDEYFVEAVLPILQDKTFAENVSLEFGYRDSSFDPQGDTESWKAGLSWEFIDGLRFRIMQQQAIRVANIGELFRPVTTGLDNATLDPCSIGNPTPPAPGSDLFNLCVQTGQLPSQVGTTQDIISGQINVFSGTNPAALPSPEEATTFTAGFVWQPSFLDNYPTTISLDYYDIDIENYINTPTGQEALDLCYVIQDPTACAGIVRIGGAFTETGTGVPAFFTNFTSFHAEGVDLAVSTQMEIGRYGELGFQLVAHKYLTQEFQTTAVSAVVDCKGFYGTSCDPVPEFRSTFRVNWGLNDFDGSLLWRHIGSMDAQANEAASLFPEFRSVDSQNYIDLSFGYTYNDWARFSLLVTNVADEDPPILGNETGSTSFNSGNTFPSLFDVVGRMYSMNVKLSF